MWRLGCVFISLALISGVFAVQLSRASATGSTEDVQPIDLPLMVLPLDALPGEFASFQFEGARFDRQDERDPGEVSAYLLAYADENAQPPSATIAVFGAVGLFSVTASASSFLTTSVQEFLASSANAQSSPVANLGDEATAFSGEPNLESAGAAVTRRLTSVIFRQGRLIGLVLIYHTSDVTGVENQAESIARSLLNRMKSVISGDITTTSAPIPPDVNCDGSLDPVDAALDLQLEARIVSSLACERIGDANRDGVVNAIDASLILQYSAGIIARLPT